MHPRYWLVLIVFLSTLASAQFTYIPITSTLTDWDEEGTPYDIRSDGRGSYQNNVDAVTTFLTSNGYNHQKYGDWQFGTISATTRRVSITFDRANAVKPGDPAYTAPADPPFWGTEEVLAHIEDKCTFIITYTANNMLHMRPRSSFTCPLIIRFPKTSTRNYRLRIARSFAFQGSESETSDALVSCNSANGHRCKDWYIDPVPQVEADGGTRPGRAIARLTLEDNNGNEINHGDFYVRFHFLLTRP